MFSFRSKEHGNSVNGGKAANTTDVRDANDSNIQPSKKKSLPKFDKTSVESQDISAQILPLPSLSPEMLHNNADALEGEEELYTENLPPYPEEINEIYNAIKGDPKDIKEHDDGTLGDSQSYSKERIDNEAAAQHFN